MVEMPTKEAERLTVGALSKRSRVNVETIRYYEKIGVMSAPSRSAAGYRLYTPQDLKRLIFVRRARELGFSLDSIRVLLRLVDGHAYTCAEVHALMTQHLADVRSKIADLQRLEKVISEMASQCTKAKTPKCPIVDALYDDSAEDRDHMGSGRATMDWP